MILPLIDYADFMIESTCYTTHKRLETLQEKAVKYIDNSLNKKLTINDLNVLYNIQPLKMRWREHICCVMYRQSKLHAKLDRSKAYMNLRSNSKVKFKKHRMRKYELYLRSPLLQGLKVWEMLSPDVQKATTKVKFKLLIRQICGQTIVK